MPRTSRYVRGAAANRARSSSSLGTGGRREARRGLLSSGCKGGAEVYGVRISLWGFCGREVEKEEEGGASCICMSVSASASVSCCCSCFIVVGGCCWDLLDDDGAVLVELCRCRCPPPPPVVVVVVVLVILVSAGAGVPPAWLLLFVVVFVVVVVVAEDSRAR